MVWIGFYRFVKCPSDADTWLPPTATSSLLFANSKRTVIYNHHFYLAWLFILITGARCPLWSDHVPALALSIVKIYVCVCVCVNRNPKCDFLNEFWNFFFLLCLLFRTGSFSSGFWVTAICLFTLAYSDFEALQCTWSCFECYLRNDPSD